MTAAISSAPTTAADEARGSVIAAHQSALACQTAPTEAVGAPEAELGDESCYFSSDSANALGRSMEGRAE